MSRIVIVFAGEIEAVLKTPRNLYIQHFYTVARSTLYKCEPVEASALNMSASNRPQAGKDDCRYITFPRNLRLEHAL